MNVVLISTCSWLVRAFIACCVTILCLALVGRACIVVYGVGFPAPVFGDTSLVGSLLGVSVLGIGCTLLIAGNFPGVLFQVARVWILGVAFSARLEVGLRACMIGGASVMWGMVMMSESSITLCSSALTLFLPPSPFVPSAVLLSKLLV